MAGKTDVIVIGAGPVGAYAAWQFAKQGLEVICLERRKASEPATDIGLFHFEHVAFERTGVPLPPEKDVVLIYQYVTMHTPDRRYETRVDGVETWALDLELFIRNLRRWAREAGATIAYNQSFVEPLREGGRIVGVIAKTAKGLQEYRAAVTVDATGLGRVLRRHVPAMNFPGGEKAFSVYMEYCKTDMPGLPEGLHSYVGPNAWSAHYGKELILGMGKPVPLEELKALHAAWWNERMGLNRREVTRAVCGAIPYAYSPPTLVDDGVLVLGDAAATNKPFNGEGIASGMIPAKIAAEELPDAIKNGASRQALWDINRRYYADQGAKFVFLHAMGEALLGLTEQELADGFAIGLVTGGDLRQTFIDYQVKKPLAQWLPPLARLALKPRMAGKYGAALLKAGRLAYHFGRYPEPDHFDKWNSVLQRLR